MGILDEAIREHLELKRQHGAEASELQQIEDEAFGPPARPDELEQPLPVSDVEAEAPTTHMAAAEVDAPPADPVEPAAAEPVPPPPAEPPPPSEPEPAAEEEHPATEHEIVTEATPPEAAPEPEDRPPAEAPIQEAPPIVEEPTQHYDVLEGEVVSEEPDDGPLDQGFEVEEAEAEPLADDDEEETEFFDEQSLSDELDQALDAPVEEQAPPEPAPVEEPPAEEPPPVEEPPPAEERPATDEAEAPSVEEGEGGGFYDQDEDVLEETPEFLQDTPESDRLWFEQKPPKDFDFDD